MPEYEMHNQIWPAYENPIESYYSVRLVPDAGYEWIDVAEPLMQGAPDNVPALTVNHLARSMRPYEPFRERPGIYLEFADLDGSKEAILSFANRYGWLNVGSQFRVPASARVVIAEGLNRWRAEISDLRLAQLIWNYVDRKDEAALAEIIAWRAHDDSVWCNLGPIKSKILIPSDARVEIANRQFYQTIEYQRWQKQGLIGTALAPAQLFTAEIVNRRLQEYCSPLMMIGEAGELVGHTVPKNLLGVIWLQFYQVITRQLHIRKCIVCGHEMDVTGCKKTKRMHDTCANRRRVQRCLAKKKGAQ